MELEEDPFSLLCICALCTLPISMMNSNRVPTQFHRDMPAQYMEAVSSYFTSELYNEEKKRNSQHGNRSQKKQKQNKKVVKKRKEGRRRVCTDGSGNGLYGRKRRRSRRKKASILA